MSDENAASPAAPPVVKSNDAKAKTVKKTPAIERQRKINSIIDATNAGLERRGVKATVRIRGVRGVGDTPLARRNQRATEAMAGAFGKQVTALKID